MPLLILLLMPFIGCLIAAQMPQTARNNEAWLAGGIAVAGLAIGSMLYPSISSGEVLRYEASWLPAYGLDFVLRLDGLAWLFSMLILAIGLLVVLYARYYMSPQDPVPRFFSFLLVFMGAMLGIVMSGNLIQLVVFWELTSVASFLLIGYWHHRADARRGARMALTVTATGGLCMLAGVLVLGHIVGSYDMDVVLASGDLVRGHDLYFTALVLIALGALTKSAQFPFHFWLPHAMAAPTPVSAYLHSATMVKAGVFLLMRLWPVLSGTPEWTWIITGAGMCTLLLGAFTAIFQHDLKGLLAYSTISHLGLITVLLGIGSSLAVVAAIFHVLNHATFKASLFMAAGIIDHETGTRDMRRLSGLRRSMPYTATLAIVAAAAMAGVPLLNGFLSKEMFFAEAVEAGSTYGWWMAALAVMMGVFSVAYSLRFISIFFGPDPVALPKAPHEPPRWMRFPVELLVLLCLLVGILPAVIVGPVLEATVVSILGDQTPSYSLAVWHGFNLPLVMSFVALLGGVAFYIILRRNFQLATRETVPLFHRFNGAQAYETTMLALSRAASFLLRLLGTERLQPQLFIMMSLLLLMPLLLINSWPDWIAASSRSDPLFTSLWVIAGACAIAAAFLAQTQRLAALALVGGSGIITAMTFLWLSAPDLALTQIMVETVTTVLILLGMRWLPMPGSGTATTPPQPETFARARDLLIAVAAGLGLAALTYAVLVRPARNRISDFFLVESVPGGGGSNVVNVLLVDFRSLDTLGEIVVLAIVALTVYALLRRFRPAAEIAGLPAQQTSPFDPATRQKPGEQANTGYLMVPGVYLRLLLPFICVVAIYFFLRGHNLPGGGFVAGLVFAVAILLQYMLAGSAWVESHLRMQPNVWLGAGLLIACATGLGAWAFGHPFLTSHTAHFHLPVLGEVHLPSALPFDLGVFGVVVGTIMLILLALAHQSLRSQRLHQDKLREDT